MFEGKINTPKKVICLILVVAFLCVSFFEPVSVFASEITNEPNQVEPEIQPDRNAKASILKKSGKTFELNSATGQKLGQYDVLQGSCSDGTYAYYVMINKNNDKARILKASLSNNETVKYSAAMNLGHGNDITYNSDTNRLVVVHYSPKPYRVSVVNPVSLEEEYNMDIDIPEELEGASSKTLKSIKGFTAIAYNAERQQYVLRIKSSHNYVLLDANMKPIKYVKVNKYNKDTNQGIDADSNYIYDLQSCSGVRNTITVYDWEWC